jgi:quercetin dioxygenase-like cupin family protein
MDNDEETEEPGAHAMRFNPDLHIVNVSGDIADPVSDGAGGMFTNIHGRSGARGITEHGEAVGVDLIKMTAGSAFEQHTHPGAHLLVIQEGRGSIAIDGVSYKLREGDSVYVPAAYDHGVSASADTGLTFLAFGVPHLPIHAPDRMTLVELATLLTTS